MSKSTSVLTDNFIGRLEQKPVQTSRYLWHINYKRYVTDLQIAAYGLQCPSNYAVFAHSNVHSFDCLYPYFMDYCRFSDEERSLCCQFSDYSFWRIDIRLLEVDWFIDPNMTLDSEAYQVDNKNYVCALHNIPSYALKLFKYDRERFVSKRPFITLNEGVASVRPFISDFDALVPDVEINNYIQWRNKNISSCK